MNPLRMQEESLKLETKKRLCSLNKDANTLQMLHVDASTLFNDLEAIEKDIEDVAARYEFRSGVELSSCYAMNTKANLKRLRLNIEKMIELVDKEIEIWETKAKT